MKITQTNPEPMLDLLRSAFPGRVSVSVPEAAYTTGESETSLRRHIKAGVIPVVDRPSLGKTARRRPLIDLRQPERATA